MRLCITKYIYIYLHIYIYIPNLKDKFKTNHSIILLIHAKRYKHFFLLNEKM